VFEPLKGCEAMVCADARESHLLPTGGCAWVPKGTQLEGTTPGHHQQDDLAGALELAPGTLRHGLGARQTTAWCRDLLALLETSDPAERSTRISVVVDHETIHTAKAVEPWLAAHPRVARLWLPTSWPRANPLERAFGDVPDGGTRHHQRAR